MHQVTRSALILVLVAAGPMAHASPPAVPADAPPAHPAIAPGDEPGACALVGAPQASVAAIMMEAGQALLWDRLRGEYVVLRPGAAFHGFTVSSVGPEQVVLSCNNQHFVLPRLASVSVLAAGAARPADASPAALPTDLPMDIIDPYPVASSASVAPEAGSPLAAPAGAEQSSAMPVDPYPPHPAVQPRPAGLGALGPPAFVLEPSAPRAPAAAPAAAPMPGEIQEERIAVRRQEIFAAAADFDALSSAIQVTLTGSGIQVIEVAPGSLPHRLGLRAGDLILTIDGQPIASLDDAAAIYARLLDARELLVALRRGERLIHMRYRFL